LLQNVEKAHSPLGVVYFCSRYDSKYIVVNGLYERFIELVLLNSC